MKKTARLNEAWDLAHELIKRNKFAAFKKLLDESDEELADWRPEEWGRMSLLMGCCIDNRAQFGALLLDRGGEHLYPYYPY